MNIWYINPYDQTPEQQATRTYDFAKELVSRGHKLTIFASSFSHYEFKEEKLKPSERWKVEYYEGIRYVWIRTFPYRGNDWRRAINMLSHAWRAFWTGMRFKENPDKIIGVSVPIVAGLSAWILSFLKKSHFYFEVRDLWPQTLIDMGIISPKSPLAWGMRTIEKFLYVKAKKIISVLPHTYIYITKFGIPRDKIIWIPNGMDLSRYQSIREYNGKILKTLTVMYVGGHASYHGLENILQAAKIIQNERKDHIKFVLIGDGPQKNNLIQLSNEMNLHNVEFRTLIPKKEVPLAVEEGDIFIAIIKNLPVLKYGTNPNKVFDYLAAGRPIIFAINSSNNPVAEAGAGVTASPEDPSSIADCIKEIISLQPEERAKMGRNGRDYLKKHFDIKILTDKLEKTLMNDYKAFSSQNDSLHSGD